MAFTSARTGDPRPIADQNLQEWTGNGSSLPPDSDQSNGAMNKSNGAPDNVVSQSNGAPDNLLPVGGSAGSAPPPSPPPTVSAPRFPFSSPPRGFPGFDSSPAASPSAEPSPILGRVPPPVQGRHERSSRSSTRAGNISFDQQLKDLEAKQHRRQDRRKPGTNLSPVAETDDSPYDTYEPFSGNTASSIAEAEVASLVYDAYGSDDHAEPFGQWVNAGAPRSGAAANVTGGVLETEDLHRVLSTTALLALSSSSGVPAAVHHALFASYHSALRADSPDAPSTHAQAVQAGQEWLDGEKTELGNHERNGSWRLIRRREVPNGRRINKFVWVYKVKRDGSIKVRLCVQGCTLVAGVDYDQTFSSTLRHSSARALFAHAARRGCHVRSIDFVSAYLQGSFLDGEVVYCHMPEGYAEKDENGVPMVCVVEKPIYGIPQAGRRLQRCLFDWLLSEGSGLRQLDDSDNTIFVYDDPSGKEVFTVGVYVDNMQIVHSVPVDENGVAVDPDSFLAKFLTRLRSDWEVVDEGPMVDLLGMECETLSDGRIKLHQNKYVEKVLAKYLPDGPPRRVSSNCLPYSPKLATLVEEALLAKELSGIEYPELVTPFQQRCGSYMYLNTSTRPDIAYPVSQLCRAMSCPTPALMAELDLLAHYLYFNPNIGLTYNVTPVPLTASADASWLTRFSTSGWYVEWQGASISWGSRKQDCVALSSCEAEIYALSECAKDVVYYRKKLAGIDGGYIDNATAVATDSKGAHDLSYNPEFHARSKHIKRRHFYVRDMVEAGELVVPLVRTDDNAADFFTKPMPPDKFIKFRNIIMNISD